jgi:hypothetical protein
MRGPAPCRATPYELSLLSSGVPSRPTHTSDSKSNRGDEHPAYDGHKAPIVDEVMRILSSHRWAPAAPSNLSARQPPSQCDTTLDHIEFALGNHDEQCYFTAETGSLQHAPHPQPHCPLGRSAAAGEARRHA